MNSNLDKINYPESRRMDLVENIHGVTVSDPYRWLEDANSAETKAWIEAQNKVTFDFLGKITEREIIRKRLTQLWNYERYSIPFSQGKRYFWTKNDGLLAQSILYVADSLRAAPKVLLDPNLFSKDGTVALNTFSISDDGKWLAYAISSGGSDWTEWKVRSVETGKDLADHLQWAKFSGAGWDHESKGFYYSRYDAPQPGEALQGSNTFQKVYYHKLGTNQDKDVLIYERKDQPNWGFGAGVTEDGRYLTLGIWQGSTSNNQFFYRDLHSNKTAFVELLNKLDAQYAFLGNVGTQFYFAADKDAPKRRVICIDIQNPSPENWKVIIPESTMKLESASIVGKWILCEYLQDAKSLVTVFDLSGKKIRDVELPGLGATTGFGGRMDQSETFYEYTSFNHPRTIFRYDLLSGKSTLFKKPNIPFDPNLFETKQVFFKSKDGTRVPMFVSYKKGLKLDGSNPTILYGYGGFNSSLTPWFSITVQTWMEMGGVYAAACIRGGGEYGKEWHDGGRLKNKQNTFDDFIAAGVFLVNERYTSPPKLAIAGGSNGGLLVGACVNQRPDLFGAALPGVGVMDMMRFHKFTIGWAWVSDYGNPDSDEFAPIIFKYSPYHNIRPGTKYPSVLVTTGDHDDRVVPLHSFKYAAALQHAQAGNAPVLIRIETRAGHGAGKPTQMAIEEKADEYGFLVKALGIKIPEQFGK